MRGVRVLQLRILNREWDGGWVKIGEMGRMGRIGEDGLDPRDLALPSHASLEARPPVRDQEAEPQDVRVTAEP